MVQWGHIDATWRKRLNLCIFRPTARSLQPKRQIDRFSRSCTAHGRKSLYFTMGVPINQNFPFPWGSGPHLSNPWCLGPMRARNPNVTSIGSAVFAQMTAECPYTLQWFTRFPFKIAPFRWGIWTPCNTWFFGPTWVLNPNGKSIVSSVLHGSLVWQTERQTDRQTGRPLYSVGNSSVIVRMYVRSNNNNS